MGRTRQIYLNAASSKGETVSDTQVYWGVGAGDLDSKFPIAIHLNGQYAGLELGEAKQLVKLLLLIIDFVESRKQE